MQCMLGEDVGQRAREEAQVTACSALSRSALCRPSHPVRWRHASALVRGRGRLTRDAVLFACGRGSADVARLSDDTTRSQYDSLLETVPRHRPSTLKVCAVAEARFPAGACGPLMPPHSAGFRVPAGPPGRPAACFFGDAIPLPLPSPLCGARRAAGTDPPRAPPLLAPHPHPVDAHQRGGREQRRAGLASLCGTDVPRRHAGGARGSGGAAAQGRGRRPGEARSRHPSQPQAGEIVLHAHLEPARVAPAAVPGVRPARGRWAVPLLVAAGHGGLVRQLQGRRRHCPVFRGARVRRVRVGWAAPFATHSRPPLPASQGMWTRSACVNDSLEVGSLEGVVSTAQRAGYAVLVTQPYCTATARRTRALDAAAGAVRRAYTPQQEDQLAPQGAAAAWEDTAAAAGPGPAEGPALAMRRRLMRAASMRITNEGAAAGQGPAPRRAPALRMIGPKGRVIQLPHPLAHGDGGAGEGGGGHHLADLVKTLTSLREGEEAQLPDVPEAEVDGTFAHTAAQRRRNTAGEVALEARALASYFVTSEGDVALPRGEEEGGAAPAREADALTPQRRSSHGSSSTTSWRLGSMMAAKAKERRASARSADTGEVSGAEGGEDVDDKASDVTAAADLPPAVRRLAPLRVSSRVRGSETPTQHMLCAWRGRDALRGGGMPASLPPLHPHPHPLGRRVGLCAHALRGSCVCVHRTRQRRVSHDGALPPAGRVSVGQGEHSRRRRPHATTAAAVHTAAPPAASPGRADRGNLRTLPPCGACRRRAFALRTR